MIRAYQASTPPPISFICLFAALLAFLNMHVLAGEREAGERLRTIATTDGETDDRCSMIRFLMYSNEWDVKGIIHSSSIYHWKGNKEHPRHNWAPVSWLDDQIDAYAKVYPNLRQNDRDYPTPDYLRSQVFVGNIAYTGDMERPTPGSQRIVEVLLDPDPSPVWLQAWGGANTIARALKTIEEKHPDRMAEVAKKTKLYLIANQDKTFDEYILKKWPKALIIQCGDFGAIGHGWSTVQPAKQQKYFEAAWMKKNILVGHGPLCAMYEAHKEGRFRGGRFRSEGDSPSFMHLIDVGLGSTDHPTYGGWGGRFKPMRIHFEKTGADDRWFSPRSADADDGKRFKSIYRWSVAFQNDWAARADWCVKSYAECNHKPVVVCNGDRTRKIIELSADPGDVVKLDAAGTSDHDGNKVSYNWWVYKEAGSYLAAPPIRDAQTASAAITVPKDASGRTIHVILEVTDNGEPPLTAYRRMILKVSGKAQ